MFGKEAAARLYSPKVEWRPGRETVIWIDRSDDTNSRLMEFDPLSGHRRMLVDDHCLAAVWGDRTGDAPTLEDPVWKPDGTAILVNSSEDPVLFDFATGTLTILNAGAGDELHARFSPNGRRIAWVRDNNLWIWDLKLNAEVGLTDDGSETVFNGVFDWVYQEELAGRDGRAFEWASDGSAIVWLRLDDGEIPVFHLVDLMDTHSDVTNQRYPKPGDPSPIPSLHVVRFNDTTGAPDRTETRFDTPVPYIPRFGLTPNGDLWYQILDRSQERLQLVRVDLLDRDSTRVLIDETDPFWILPVDDVHFLDDGSVLWRARRSGNMHLYRIHPDGDVVSLTSGDWDVTDLIGVDPSGQFAWIQAARPSPLERRLFRIEIESGETMAVTPVSGTNSADLAPSGRLLVKKSSFGAPPRWKVVDGLGAAAAEVPVEHPVPAIDFANHRWVEVTTDDGFRLDAMLLFPPDFDNSRRYPVVIYTYGGPNAQVVRDQWPRNSGLFNHTLANHGFVVFALDNRGSAARGREFEGATDLNLGSKQLPDQLAGVEWLGSQPWVDPNRIGIWGWSYGGYMTTYALTHAPGVFAAGAAVAPVTDWRLYDSIYTERYMGSPDTNPEGYASGSVLDAVAELADPLLVIHGTGDDNVHVQHTMQLADQAWRAGVRFDLVLFPNLTHGINAPGSHLQVFSAITDFFERHLMAEDGEDR